MLDKAKIQMMAGSQKRKQSTKLLLSREHLSKLANLSFSFYTPLIEVNLQRATFSIWWIRNKSIPFTQSRQILTRWNHSRHPKHKFIVQIHITRVGSQNFKPWIYLVESAPTLVVLQVAWCKQSEFFRWKNFHKKFFKKNK